MKARWLVIVGLVILAAVSIVVVAQDSEASSSSGSLWGATAIGGVGGVALTQFLKKMINKVAPNLLGPKSTYSLSWIASFGVGVVAYLLFPAGRQEILSQAFSIFQGGATASALSSGIYKLFGGLLGMKSTTA